LPNFSGVNDTAEINVTPLKSQTDFTSPFSSFKGKIQQKYFNGKYPHITQVQKKQKKDGGCLDLIFGFSGVNNTTETDFGYIRRDYLGEYDDICTTGLACESGTYMGLIYEKNRESKISCNCPFKQHLQYLYAEWEITFCVG
jgi:hypothetical protein